MAADKKKLVRDWIQYLKSNQIVALNSDPETGKLVYKRPVTADDLAKFLESASDFGEEAISAAIHQVLTKSTVNKSGQKQIQNTPKQKPAPEQPKRLGAPKSGPMSLSHDPNSISDIDYREINEDFGDTVGIPNLGEDDVEAVIDILSSGSPKAATPPGRTQKKGGSTTSPETDLKDQQKKEEEVRKIKRVIRDVMTPAQRKALWRLLVEEELSEAQVTTADAKEILKGAAELRSKSGVMGKLKGLGKDKVELSDLQQAWKDDGYPDDTRDIYAILNSQFGYSDKEIRKVFSNVFGKSDDDEGDYAAPVASEPIQKIAEFARKNEIVDVLKTFMQNNFAEELGLESPGLMTKMKRKLFKQKAVHEEIRQIFSDIIKEERHSRFELIKQQELVNLGRNKK